jgi:hypothetical protein
MTKPSSSAQFAAQSAAHTQAFAWAAATMPQVTAAAAAMGVPPWRARGSAFAAAALAASAAPPPLPLPPQMPLPQSPPLQHLDAYTFATLLAQMGATGPPLAAFVTLGTAVLLVGHRLGSLSTQLAANKELAAREAQANKELAASEAKANKELQAGEAKAFAGRPRDGQGVVAATVPEAPRKVIAAPFAGSAVTVCNCEFVSEMMAGENVKVPVLAAGGIIDGRGIAAGMVLGAQGAWIGTRFIATRPIDGVLLRTW